MASAPKGLTADNTSASRRGVRTTSKRIETAELLAVPGDRRRCVAAHSGRESRRGFTASPSRCGDGNHLRSQPGFPRPEFLPPLALTATLARSCCRTKCEDERSVWIRRNRRRLQTFGTWFAPSPESLGPVMISNCLFVDALHSSG